MFSKEIKLPQFSVYSFWAIVRENVQAISVSISKFLIFSVT